MINSNDSTGGIVLEEWEYGFADADESITYPGLSVCIGLTIVSSYGDKAGAHLVPPTHTDSLQKYHWALGAILEFYDYRGGRFIVSGDLNPDHDKHGGLVGMHLDHIIKLKGALAGECESMWKQVKELGYFKDIHACLCEPASIISCFKYPVHQILPNGDAAADGRSVLQYPARRAEQISLF